MKRIILCMFIIVGLHADELDYNYIEDNYIENNIRQNAKKPTNNAKTRQNRQKQTNNTKAYESRKQAKLRELAKKKRLDEGKKEASGFILGAGISTGVVGSPNSNAFLNSGFNLLAGYKWFYSLGFGHRLYVDYTAGFIKLIQSADSIIQSNNTHDFALNYDLLFNWVRTRGFKFGMLLGNNMGVNVAQSASFSFGINIGFRFGIFNNHSIEVFVQPKYLFGSSCDSYGCTDTTNGIGGSVRGILRYVYTF